MRAAQAAGLSLAEIRGILEVRDGGLAPCSHVGALIDEKVSDIDDRIEALTSTRAALHQLAVRARTLDPADCGSEEICHIIAIDPR